MKNRALIIIGICLASLAAQAQQLRVASYNIRNKNAGDSIQGDGWKQRCPAIANLVKFHDFDIFGTQEGIYIQQEDLVKALPGYAYTGAGRDDGKRGGEYASILYKKQKFRLLKSGTFWLAPVTDKPVKGWDAMFPRTCSWAKFKELKSGLEFYFFNIHFDHVGVQARAESTKLMLARIKEIAGTSPVIFTGDFNTDQNSEPYTILSNSGVLKDAYAASPVKYATNGTFNGFDANAHSNSRIDHIFISRQFKPERYAVLSDTYFGPSPADAKLRIRLPSDHFPVMTVLSY